MIFLQSLQSGRISNFSYNLSRASSCASLDSMMRPDSVQSVSRALSRSTTNLCDLTPGPGIEPPMHVISNIAGHVVKHWKQLRKHFKVSKFNSFRLLITHYLLAGVQTSSYPEITLVNVTTIVILKPGVS